MKLAFSLYICAVLAFLPMHASARASLALLPDTVVQGEPAMVRMEGVANLKDINQVIFEGKSLSFFLYNGMPTALVGIGITAKTGLYPVKVFLTDGSAFEQTLTVVARPKIEAPLGIPEKLGGNTTASQKALVSALASENVSLIGLKTGTKAFWSKPFLLPLASTTVTDPYGYSRQTGSYTITHKGVDLRAAEGTPVLAMNRGVVRLVRSYKQYGKTVVVDHGLGLMTFYMHLSKIKVWEGQLVQQGQIIGLSGETGYAESPHLHLTVRINDTSIDPQKFLDLFK